MSALRVAVVSASARAAQGVPDLQTRQLADKVMIFYRACQCRVVTSIAGRCDPEYVEAPLSDPSRSGYVCCEQPMQPAYEFGARSAYAIIGQYCALQKRIEAGQ